MRTSIPFCCWATVACKFLNFLVLFEELVEQHVVDLLVVDGRDFTVLAVHHELGIHLGDLLGDQTILLRGFPVAVEFEGYWLEPVQCFTGLVHRLNVVFEPPGRVEDAHYVKLIDIYLDLASRVANRLTEDVADEAGVIKDSKRTCTRCADRDAVTDACPQTGAGLVTDSDLPLPSTSYRSASSPMAVLLVPDRVVFQREITERIVFAAGIVHERVTTMGVVEGTFDVVSKRGGTDGVVVGAAVVMDKRISFQRQCSHAPVVLSNNAAAPTAVLLSALLRTSAPAPTPVLPLPLVFKERIPSNSCVSSPGGEVTQRVASFRRREVWIAPVWCRVDRLRSR